MNGKPLVEEPSVEVRTQKGSIKLRHMSIGPLTDDGGDGLIWEPKEPPDLDVGDKLIVADGGWFDILNSGHELTFDRPKPDAQNAPKPDCGPYSYGNDPESHQWCCRSHETSEAQWSDVLAERRARGELNPQAWPPVVDEDQFDTPAVGTPTDASEDADDAVAPDLTIDDIE